MDALSRFLAISSVNNNCTKSLVLCINPMYPLFPTRNVATAMIDVKLVAKLGVLSHPVRELPTTSVYLLICQTVSALGVPRAHSFLDFSFEQSMRD